MLGLREPGRYLQKTSHFCTCVAQSNLPGTTVSTRMPSPMSKFKPRASQISSSRCAGRALKIQLVSRSPADADPYASCLFQSPPLTMTAASNTVVFKGSTFVASEVLVGRSQTTEALGLSSGTWHSKWQLRKASFTKALSAPLKRVGKCGRGQFQEGNMTQTVYNQTGRIVRESILR